MPETSPPVTDGNSQTVVDLVSAVAAGTPDADMTRRENLGLRGLTALPVTS